METYRITALLAVYLLPLQLVAGQFGIFFDQNLKNYRYYQSLQCRVSNLYTQSYFFGPAFTERNDINCCYMAGTRNQCCEETSYNTLTFQFTSKCRCDPSITCGSGPTPVVTTPKPTENKFCPTVGSRLLNSLTVSDNCGAFPGVFSVANTINGFTSICNAVLAQAFINGVSKTTLVTSSFCSLIAESSPSALSIRVSPTVQIPMTKFNKIAGRDGVAFFDPVDTTTLQQLTSSCSKIACGLRHPDMEGKIDYNDCQILSYGAYQSTTLAQSGLRSVAVRIYPQGCRGIQTLPVDPPVTNTLCFTTHDRTPTLCSADFGAPVFCKSITTGENIVVGVNVGSQHCGRDPSFHVIQYPTF